MEWQIQQADELGAIVKTILNELTKHATTTATVLALSGDLGAGKTTFVQILATELGVTETVTSPTFVVMKSYETRSAIFPTLIHMDAYRIADQAELAPLHFAEMLGKPNTLVCIEWAELIKSALPANIHHLTIAVTGETTRTLTYEVRKS